MRVEPPSFVRGPLTSFEDLAQDLEVERAAGGRVNATWIAADRFRQERGRDGRFLQVPIARDVLKIAAPPTAPQAELATSLPARAIRCAEGLPLGPARSTILLALRLLTASTTEERLRVWLDANPGRQAKQGEIAAEIGATRESVNRTIARLRRAS